MPVKMVALRRHYSPDDKKEFEAGQTFNVATDREADRLVRMRRAKRDDAPAKPAPSAVKNKVMRAETAPEPAAEPAPALEATGGITHTTDNNAPSGEINANRSNRYRRNDMRSED
jgi:hypothetical protein